MTLEIIGLLDIPVNSNSGGSNQEDGGLWSEKAMVVLSL